jgi:hypothetical protein
MSTSRATLRQAIGIRTSQPFFVKFGGSAGTASASGTTTTLLDTVKLKEADNYWRGQYIYFNDTLEVREISAFANSSSTLTWLAAIAAATTTSSDYELWSTFSPVAVNEAINDALRDAWPYFFEVGTANLAILDTVPALYTLPTTNTIRSLFRVTLLAYDSFTGEATSDGSTTSKLTDTAQTFVSATHVGQRVVIYDGDHAAAGDIRTISAVDSTDTITVSSAFTSTITDGTKYRIYNPNTENPSVIPLSSWRTDAPNFPTTLWLDSQPSEYAGHILRLEYTYEYDVLTTEAGTTTCPREYVVLAALARLYLMKLAYAPAVEQRTWEAMHRVAMAAAQQFALRNRFQHPTRTITRWFPDKSYAADYPFIE